MSNSGYYDGILSGDMRCSDFTIDDDHYADWIDYFDECRKPVLEDRKKKGCDHEWKTYKGFTEDYEYCSKCDIKRDELDE